MFPGITGNRDRPSTTDSHDLPPSEDEQNCRMQDIGATLDAVKAAQARAENTDAVFAQLWRERTAWAKDCLEAHGINDKIAARDAALAARFADIDTDDKDPLVQLLARDASLAGTSSSQIELSSDDQNGEIKSDCEHLLRATESAQAQVEYAAAECASADLARLVARFGTVELEHRRRHLLARWMAAEALSGELIASSRLTHHVEAYISALEQKHSFVRGASQSLASRWPELSESVYEPLYHEIDRPLSSSSKIVAPIPLGQDAHNELPIADFIKLLLQEDDSGMCNSVQIPALCALSLETSHSPKSSSSPKTSQHAAGAAWGQNAGQRPPWNPSVLVHDPIRTRGGAEPIGKRQLAHLFSSNSSLAVRTEKDNIQRAMYAVSTSARSPMATPTSDAKATLSPSLVKARIDAVLLAD
ncbi:Hypothetical Protein FCC1311_107422 [Hondaea fermentalgiana]|uniref:Uncharacterized protein n=1 Tax=Hondaea fermentalgiana TaxID=2315210 RepID=A0A2R5GXK2_9STRA|nr:Hypothetical Protein FCC1311_107422 [Hondaea fermentalgiana]|eukprot:GBG34518.1 Hypothetical Protein FCC1311_107422 [Hondaea fermentalgiana]